MDGLSTINKLITEFENAHNSKGAISFFRKSPEAYLIFLTIMRSFYSNEPITIEKLIHVVSPRYCSRQTVKNITNNALQELIIMKKIDKKDMRKKYFIPSENTIKEFNIWISKSLKDL